MKRRAEDGTLEGSFIMGLTNQPLEMLALLARSWLRAPDLKNVSRAFINEGYSKQQRAYILHKAVDKPLSLEMEVAASKDSPIVNPAFVVKNWGDANVELKIDQTAIQHSKNFRYGHQVTTEGIDLTVWIKRESVEPLRIEFLPLAP